MKLTKEQLAELETPCIVIDVAQAQANICSMQQAINAAGCTLRPHVKTHKMPFFAKMQMEAGAVGITCAKVSEAEVMAEYTPLKVWCIKERRQRTMRWPPRKRAS